MRFVAGHLADPTRDLLSAIKVSIQSCDAVLMEMCGHRRYLGPPPEVSGDIPGSLVRLRKKMIAFSRCQDDVLASDRLHATRVDSPEVRVVDIQPMYSCKAALDGLHRSSER